MGDLFGEWVPREWIDAVLQVVRECPQHTFIFLSKNPARYEDYEWPANCWIGATVESSYTASRLVYVSRIKAAVRFVSFEPLLGPVEKFDLADLKDLNWVIIGAQTGPSARPAAPGWVKNIISQARAANIPVFLKNNLKWPEKIRAGVHRLSARRPAGTGRCPGGKQGCRSRSQGAADVAGLGPGLPIPAPAGCRCSDHRRSCQSSGPPPAKRSNLVLGKDPATHKALAAGAGLIIPPLRFAGSGPQLAAYTCCPTARPGQQPRSHALLVKPKFDTLKLETP